MRITIAILAVIVFWLGAYYMGNYVCGTFDKPFLFNQITSTMYGVLVWVVIGGVIFISIIVYRAIEEIFD